MLIASIGDIQLSGKNLIHGRAQLNAAADVIIKRGCQLVTMPGDLYEDSNIHDIHGSTGEIEGVLIDFVGQLNAVGIHIITMPGNHDMSGAGAQDCLTGLNHRPLVTVIREPEAFFHTVTSGLGMNGIAIPWSWAGESAEDVITGLVKTLGAGGPVDLFLAHIEVIGGLMSSTRCCEAKPGRWQISRGFLESLPVKHFALAHFNRRQDLTEGRGGYIGHLFQETRGDEGNPQGFEIWDSTTDTTEWIELNAAPRFVTVTFEQSTPVESIKADPNTITLARGDKGILTREQIIAIERQGIEVEESYIPPERLLRSPVPDGILNDRHGIIDLSAAVQIPPFTAERLARGHRIYDLIHAHKTKQELQA